MDAEVLAGLEGWGQTKRIAAKLCAEMHNVAIINRYATHGDINAPAPNYMTEQHFLSKRVFKLNIVKTVDKEKSATSIKSAVSQLINSMAGF